MCTNNSSHAMASSRRLGSDLAPPTALPLRVFILCKLETDRSKKHFKTKPIAFGSEATFTPHQDPPKIARA